MATQIDRLGAYFVAFVACPVSDLDVIVKGVELEKVGHIFTSEFDSLRSGEYAAGGGQFYCYLTRNAVAGTLGFYIGQLNGRFEERVARVAEKDARGGVFLRKAEIAVAIGERKPDQKRVGIAVALFEQVFGYAYVLDDRFYGIVRAFDTVRQADDRAREENGGKHFDHSS